MMTQNIKNTVEDPCKCTNDIVRMGMLTFQWVISMFSEWLVSTGYFMYKAHRRFSGSQQRGWPPPKGHEINLRGHHMINPVGMITKLSLDTQASEI